MHVLLDVHEASNDLSAGNSDQQPRFIRINKNFQQFLIDGLQSFLPTNFQMGQIHYNLRINFGIHHEVRQEFPSMTPF